MDIQSRISRLQQLSYILFLILIKLFGYHFLEFSKPCCLLKLKTSWFKKVRV